MMNGIPQAPWLRLRDPSLTLLNHSNVPRVATTADSENEDSKATSKEAAPPSLHEKEDAQATAGAPLSQSSPDSASKKRVRDDDAGVEDDRSAKKVDSKLVDAPATTALEIKETPKKRAREEDVEPTEGQAVKKVATGAEES